MGSDRDDDDVIGNPIRNGTGRHLLSMICKLEEDGLPTSVRSLQCDIVDRSKTTSGKTNYGVIADPERRPTRHLPEVFVVFWSGSQAAASSSRSFASFTCYQFLSFFGEGRI